METINFKYSTIYRTIVTGWGKLDSQRGGFCSFRATSYQLGIVKHSIKVSMAAPYILRANSLSSIYPLSAGSLRMASNIHSAPRNGKQGILNPGPLSQRVLYHAKHLVSFLEVLSLCGPVSPPPPLYSDHLSTY